MRTLQNVTPTGDQLQILREALPGVTVIRGAAGSGKTTAALLRLKFVAATWSSRKQLSGSDEPVRALVLTFNRTLQGYLDTLAFEHVPEGDSLHLEVSTFSRWARSLIGGNATIKPRMCEQKLRSLCMLLSPDNRDFLLDEAAHILGRFDPADFESYMDATRPGRGPMPFVDYSRRRTILDEIIYPYRAWKSALGLSDWHDVAYAARIMDAQPWDIVIVDEAQDFNAISLRTVLSHVSADHHITLVMDTVQRIYPAGFLLEEARISPAAVHTLRRNYRNTQQIARFARAVVDGLEIDDDGSLPDFNAARTNGTMPQVIVGDSEQQLRWALDNVVQPAIARNESVGFLSPYGGERLSGLKQLLDRQGVAFAEITQRSNWPAVPALVALSTLHSAKGLEFDHVVICELHCDVTPHGIAHNDSRLEVLRRLLAMGIGRARFTVTVGYDRTRASTLVRYLDPSTFEILELDSAAA